MEKKGAVLPQLLITLIVSSSSCFFFASATTCTDVDSNIQPCLGYLNGLMPISPSPACCDGLKVLVNLGNEMGVGSACYCTKAFLVNIPGLDVDVKVFNNLQSKCEVDIGFNLSNKTQCVS